MQLGKPVFSQLVCIVVSLFQLFKRASGIHLLLYMARKVDEDANFVFVQLIEQEPGIHDKRHPDYARRDKMDLACEGISHEMKESGFWLSSFETI
jgi:hypothetical protein